MVLLGPRREEKPVARKVGAERKASGSAAGRRGQNSGSKAGAAQHQQGAGGSGRVTGRASAPASAPTRPVVLPRLADREQQRENRPAHPGRAAFSAGEQSERDDVGALAALLAAAKGGHDVLASLAELLGAPQQRVEDQAPLLPAAVPKQQDLPAAVQQRPPQHQYQQQGLPGEEHALAARSPGEPARQALGPTDFSKRNMARLGGEGVAGIFGGSSAGPALRRVGAANDGAGYMSALHALKPGLSDEQAARQAAQREQLKRDLEEQMRLKREAEAARKAELAALEEREEAQLRAYWAAQARAAQGEVQHAGLNSRAGDRQAADGACLRAGQQGSVAWQQQRQDTQPNRERKGAGHMAPAAAGQHGPQSHSLPGSARRGEALLQPGITVFLPPDKEAERRGALRARAFSQSQSEEAEVGSSQEQPVVADGHRNGQHKPLTPSSAAALQQALVQQAMAGGLLAAQQQQQQAQALLAPWLAAANPGLAVAAGLPALYPALPQLLLSLPGTSLPAASSALPASAPSSSTEPQMVAMLRGLAAEQQQMREQLAAQLEAVTRLAGDASAARSERDRARQDLERVQRLLAERQQGGIGGGGVLAGFGSNGDEDMFSVTTHVLPLGMGIPSRLGTPAGKGAQSQRMLHNPFHTALPARYRQQASEPWQAPQQSRGGGAASKAHGRAEAAAASGRADQAGALGSSSRRKAAAATKPAGAARGTWRK